MPLQPIPLTKGSFQSVNALELPAPEYATELRNLVLNDAGSNVDRPALSSFASIGSFAVEGLFYFSGHLVAVTGDRRIWKITSTGAVTEITGTPLAGGSRPVFASDGDFLAIAGGNSPQKWDGASNASPMDGSPPSCKFISILDSYWVTHLIDDQEFRFAGPTAPTRLTWTSADFFQAEGLADNVKSQAVLMRELYAFGEESTEIFQNFGDASTPFRRTFFIDKGILAPYSVVQADNTLFWFDSGRRFVRMTDRTPVEISTPYSSVLKRMTTVDDCWAARIDIDGFFLIAWTFPTEQRTLVFDYKKNEWCEWDCFSDGQSTRFKMHSYAFVKAWNKHFVGDPNTGSVYELSFDNKTDGDSALRRLRRTGQIDHGSGARKRSNYYLLHVKRGVGTPGETEPVLQMRVNDDGEGWTDYVDVPLGFPGDLQGPIRVDGLRGIYRKRQIEFHMTDPSALVIARLEESVEALE